MYISIQTISK